MKSIDLLCKNGNVRSFYGNQLVDFHFIADANVSVLLSNRTKEIVSVCIVFFLNPASRQRGRRSLRQGRHRPEVRKKHGHEGQGRADC
jgi:hypothetical protein